MKIFIILFLFLCCSCSPLSVALTPSAIKDSVSRSAAVARMSVENPPGTLQELYDYLEVNKNAWQSLEEWFDVKEND